MEDGEGGAGGGGGARTTKLIRVSGVIGCFGMPAHTGPVQPLRAQSDTRMESDIDRRWWWCWWLSLLRHNHP
ncbi:hypothetical protein ZHAS_00010237 [Anopheles sinensis]|uniref:Uncharacterized protein n=1 Tax=Anopheles sinensis TaxID=74873 RepID=A0A084VX34_ANOSI|nr:hypothetical protein ZHAS_00010237 [Anopheles sinensis]